MLEFKFPLVQQGDRVFGILPGNAKLEDRGRYDVYDKANRKMREGLYLVDRLVLPATEWKQELAIFNAANVEQLVSALSQAHGTAYAVDVLLTLVEFSTEDFTLYKETESVDTIDTPEEEEETEYEYGVDWGISSEEEE